MLDRYQHDWTELQGEVDAFEELMRPGLPLAEKQDILPFFRKNRHLAACLGYANNYLVLPDLLGFERPLLGFQCDIAIGDSQEGQFSLVELEDASHRSIFETAKNRRTFPRWSHRFNTGFAQLLDWAWRLDQEGRPSVPLVPVFGTSNPKVHYVLVTGRDHWLDDTAKARLEWRRQHSGIHGATIWTYDDFVGFVRQRVASVNAPRI